MSDLSRALFKLKLTQTICLIYQGLVCLDRRVRHDEGVESKKKQDSLLDLYRGEGYTPHRSYGGVFPIRAN